MEDLHEYTKYLGGFKGGKGSNREVSVVREGGRSVRGFFPGS